MQAYPFIFSDRYRLQRHLLLWFCWWFFQSILYSYTAGLSLIPNYKRLPISTVEALVYLVPHIFLSYSLMYWVLPRLLLKSKYLLTFIAVIVLFFCTAVISAFIGVYFIEDIRHFILPKAWNETNLRAQNVSFFLSLLAGLRGGITIGGMTASIKLMKFWYIKEQKNLQLQKENIDVQLKLLKAQVHPHFLFNTLNNIYSNTQNTSPVASKLVLGLSDMLRYMLYECDRQFVPLSNELKMLNDYIMLEKIRYGNKLDVNIDVPDNAEDFLIAPLLLLPFVENSFKHGTSQMLEQPWMSLTINIDGGVMNMKLLNGKADNTKTTPGASGLGIANVQHRLDLLYPGKHSLKITNLEEVFIVELKLELEEKSKTDLQFINSKKAAVYE